METHELQEQTEHAHHQGEKAVGLTMAVTAVLLAVATLSSHRAHTEEIKLQTKVNDSWGFYQAKHGRAHQYGKSAEDEVLANHKDVAQKDLRISTEEECGVPVAEHCSSPVIKDSPVLQQFIKEIKAGNAKTETQPDSKPEKENATEKPAGPAAGAREGATHEKKVKALKEGAVTVQEHTKELEAETDRIAHRADLFDSAELFLEISIVLCSITLLAGSKLYWRLSFVSSLVGVGIVVWAYVQH